ncbi:hypothetical protein [Streptomyces lavendofoliae]|uniref:Uncharacterized protein n=1 Tax=Streptomyces lavendofoliae TaxID=67314 RepID=A0A918M5V1_9ACTN|nr:hypothetical protein [Streptomyces lavendofoliae]GGU52101.1 hypothetical protein GCM10010274_46270 [Streptomyces lavendofoliae]
MSAYDSAVQSLINGGYPERQAKEILSFALGEAQQRGFEAGRRATRAEVLREAAGHIEAEQKRSDDHEVSRFGKLDHESVLERDAVLAAVAELRLMADAAVSGSTAGGEQPEVVARPPLVRWRVEIYDPLAKEWVPSVPFLVRERAVERLNTEQIHSPRWADDATPVDRRLVRETTTYKVEEVAS